MRASTLFLGFTFAALTGALALLWQAFGPRPAPPAPVAKREPPAVTAAPRASDPEPPGVRTVYPGARPSAARPPHRDEPPPPAASEARPAAPERNATAEPPAAPEIVEPPRETEPAETGEGVDLNTASLEQLNGLGAGMVGKTIIANRPYAAPDDLVTRRVLTRRDYEAIRPHLVVR